MGLLGAALAGGIEQAATGVAKVSMDQIQAEIEQNKAAALMQLQAETKHKMDVQDRGDRAAVNQKSAADFLAGHPDAKPEDIHVAQMNGLINQGYADSGVTQLVTLDKTEAAHKLAVAAAAAAALKEAHRYELGLRREDSRDVAADAASRRADAMFANIGKSLSKGDNVPSHQVIPFIQNGVKDLSVQISKAEGMLLTTKAADKPKLEATIATLKVKHDKLQAAGVDYLKSLGVKVPDGVFDDTGNTDSGSGTDTPAPATPGGDGWGIQKIK